MDKMAVTKSDLFPNDTMGLENKTVIVTTILVRTLSALINRASGSTFSEHYHKEKWSLMTKNQLTKTETNALCNRNPRPHYYYSEWL